MIEHIKHIEQIMKKLEECSHLEIGDMTKGQMIDFADAMKELPGACLWNIPETCAGKLKDADTSLTPTFN